MPPPFLDTVHSQITAAFAGKTVMQKSSCIGVRGGLWCGNAGVTADVLETISKLPVLSSNCPSTGSGRTCFPRMEPVVTYFETVS